MADQDKTKEQLIKELQALRARVILLEQSAPMLPTAKERTDPEPAVNTLCESETRYRKLFDRVPVGLFRITSEGKFLEANSALVEMLKYPDLATLLEANVNELYVDLKQRQAWQAALAQSGEVTSYVGQLRCYDGTLLWVESHARIIRDASEQIYYEGVLKDINERKIAEEALKASEARYRLLVENQTDLVTELDTDYRLLFVSPSYCETFGQTADQLLGQDIMSLIHEEDRERIAQALRQVFCPPYSNYHEERALTAKGWRWLAWSSRAVLDQDGRVHSIVAIGRDITEQRQIEETAQQTRQQLQDMFDHTPAAVYMKDMTGRFIFVNRVVHERMGFPASEILGKTLWEIYPELKGGPNECWEPHEKQVLASGEATTFEEFGRTTGKSYLATKFLLYDADGAPYALCNSSIDITERKRVEDALQRYTGRLQILYEVAQAILTTKSPQKIAIDVLKYIRRLIPAQRANIWVIDDQTNERVLLATVEDEVIQAVGERHPFESDWRVYFLQGEPMIIDDLPTFVQTMPSLSNLLDYGFQSVVLIPMVVQGQLIGALSMVATGSLNVSEEDLQIAREVADQLAVAIRQFHLSEQIQQHTEQLEQRVAERTAELEVANEELRVLTRMKDQFVSNVSHELRTPITNMMLQIYLAAKTATSQQRERLSILKREAKRLEDLIESLLFLSRLDQDRVTLKFEETDLNKLVGRLVQDRQSLGQQQGLHLSFISANGCPLIMGDSRLIGQVVSILLTNAINYTPQDGHIEAEIIYNNQWAGFRVSDTGPGIPSDEHEQLFLRFFRGQVGRNSGKSGTGLGLSIAKEIVDRHHGQIEVESEGIPGRGATFKVWLPVKAEKRFENNAAGAEII